MHEEDFGILWKHKDWRTGRTEVRRSRRLVVSSIATVGNYEYGFYWYLYLDGRMQFEVKLTGIMNTAAVPPGMKPKYGTLVAPQLYAQIHQHIFNVRLEMCVDGLDNSVLEINTRSEAEGPQNRFGNAFFAEATPLATEAEAQRTVNASSGRHWVVVNPARQNYMGEPVGYRLVPGENTVPFSTADSSVSRRAGFTSKHLWATRYDPKEKFPAGDYPNQHAGGAGLPTWVRQNRSLVSTEIVLWYSFGHLHLPRLEDWPVTPVTCTGFTLEPVGFFDRNPALDVPPAEPKSSCH
jgi:primary-amine oxidase